MDAMHLVVHKIKEAWRRKKAASILFLNIQAAFSSTAKEQLFHNMRSRQVPSIYINLFEHMLSNHQTQIHFNDFMSDPISITIGTTQGCTLSMLLYTIYNADLVDIAKGKSEVSTGFVDDCTFIVTGDTLEATHQILKNMMEHPGGGLDWS